MNILILLDSILTGFEVVVFMLIISYLWGKAQSDIKWLIALSGLLVGVLFYMMRTI